jgi:Holliday junction resolvase
VDDSVSSDSFGRALEFEAFVRRIIEAEPDVDIVRAPRSQDHGVDIAARYDGRLLLVEVKLATPQTSYRLEQAIQQFRGRPI